MLLYLLSSALVSILFTVTLVYYSLGYSPVTLLQVDPWWIRTTGRSEFLGTFYSGEATCKYV